MADAPSTRRVGTGATWTAGLPSRPGGPASACTDAPEHPWEGQVAVREYVIFRLRLGAETDAFKDAFLKVRAAMREIGVEPGRTWGPLTGEAREIILEREFESLAAYEADDAAFHGDPEFMALWRRMESHAASMRVELWEGPAWD